MKKILAVLLIYNTITVAFATSKDGETRTAVLNYDIEAMDVIDIQAKYTDLSVDAWDQDQVQIEATLRFDGKMTDKMRKFIDNFEEEVENGITYGAGQLTIKTNLDEPNKFQLGGKNVGIVISFNEEELKIDYSIKVPAVNSLKIKNSYRDLYLNGSFSNVTIDQYSGDLKADSMDEADIKLKYGSAQFNFLGQANMELYEQDIKAEQIDELEINTKYSELKINKLGEVEITAYETDFEIEYLAFIEGNLKYGMMEINERLEEGELTTYEFDFEAEEIGSLTFESSKYGKFEAEKVDDLTLVESYEDDFDIDELGNLIAKEEKYDNFQIGQLTKGLTVIGYEGEINIDKVAASVSSIEIEGKYIDTAIGLEGIDYQLSMNTKYGKNNIDRSSEKVTRYIKDGDNLEVEVTSNKSAPNPVSISIKGYEMDLDISE